MINLIEIKGYKTIRDLSIELKPINILIGANGVGKSNFISFFKLLENIYNQNLESYSMQEGAENLLHFGRRVTGKIECEIQFNNINAYFFTLIATNADSLFLEEEFCGFNRVGSGRGWRKDYFISRNSKETGIHDKGYYVAKYVKFFLQSFRVYHFHDTSINARAKQKGNIDDNRILSSDAGNLAAYLYYLQEKHPKTLKRIELTIQSVAPFFDRFVLQPDRLNSNMIQLEWREKGSANPFFAAHLSDGTLRFIALTTLLSQPEPPAVIIIDEPELGLHPFAINKLAALFRKASAQSQIIVATQSMNLIDNFEPHDIIAIDREDGQSVMKRLDDEQLKTWLDEYHSLSTLWNKNVLGGTP